MIVSDYISACKSNYHAITITITTAPFKCKRCTSCVFTYISILYHIYNHVLSYVIDKFNHIQMSISTGWECSVFTPRNWLSSNRIPHSYCAMKSSNKIVVFIQMCYIFSVSSNLVHDEVYSIQHYVIKLVSDLYSIQHYVIKFVSDLRHVGGFLLIIRYPPPIKLTARI